MVVISFLLSILATIYVIVSMQKIASLIDLTLKEKNWLQRKFPDYKYAQNMILTSFTRIMIYYEQSISQILSAGTVYINFITFTAIFNLSVQENANVAGWCFAKYDSETRDFMRIYSDWIYNYNVMYFFMYFEK